MKRKKKSGFRIQNINAVKSSYLVALGMFFVLGAFSMGLYRSVQNVFGYVGGMTAQIGGSQETTLSLLRTKLESDKKQIAVYQKIIQDNEQAVPFAFTTFKKDTISFVEVGTKQEVSWSGTFLPSIYEVDSFVTQAPTYDIYFSPDACLSFSYGVCIAQRPDFYPTNIKIGTVDVVKNTFEWSVDKAVFPGGLSTLSVLKGRLFLARTKIGLNNSVDPKQDILMTSGIVYVSVASLAKIERSPFTKISDFAVTQIADLPTGKNISVKWKPDREKVYKDNNSIALYIESKDKTGTYIHHDADRFIKNVVNDGSYLLQSPITTPGVYRLRLERNDGKKAWSNFFTVGTLPTPDKTLIPQQDYIPVNTQGFNNISWFKGLVDTIQKRDVIVEKEIKTLESGVPFAFVSPKTGDTVSLDGTNPKIALEWTGAYIPNPNTIPDYSGSVFVRLLDTKSGWSVFLQDASVFTGNQLFDLNTTVKQGYNNYSAKQFIKDWSGSGTFVIQFVNTFSLNNTPIDARGWLDRNYPVKVLLETLPFTVKNNTITFIKK